MSKSKINICFFKALTLVLLLIMLCSAMLLFFVGCDNDPPLEPIDTTAIANTMSYDVTITSGFGLEYLCIPFMVGKDFDKEFTKLEGDGIDDLNIELSSKVLSVPWYFENHEELYVSLLFFRVTPKDNFDKSIQLRKITGIVFGEGVDEQIVTVNVNLHTVDSSNEAGKLIATQDRLRSYFDTNNGNNIFEITTPLDLSGMYANLYSGIIIKSVRFAYGNLKIVNSIKIIERSRDIYKEQTFYNPANIEHSIITPGTTIGLYLEVESLQDKELLADTIVIDYSTVDEPDKVYSVYGHSIVFADRFGSIV